jgi:hypothetical protein
MTRNVHDEVRELIALGDGISDDQQSKLRNHLRECAACSDYADAARGAVNWLRSQPLTADAELVRATQMRVRSRALELRQQQERIWVVCTACLFVGLTAAITTPLFWRGFEWMGTQAGVSNWVWQSGFAFTWVAPALVVSTLLMVRGTHLRSGAGN